MSEALLGEAGIPRDGAGLALVEEYVQRTKRARRLGLVAGLAALFIVVGEEISALSFSVAVLLAGYLLGVLPGELRAPLRRRGTVRSASLHPRQTASMLPIWAHWAPWMTLLPAAGAPLPLVGSHPRSATSHAADGASMGVRGLPADLIGLLAGWASSSPGHDVARLSQPT